MIQINTAEINSTAQSSPVATMHSPGKAVAAKASPKHTRTASLCEDSIEPRSKRARSLSTAATSSTIDVAPTPAAVSMSLTERVYAVQLALDLASKQSFYSAGTMATGTITAPLNRQTEFDTILKSVATALKRGQGHAMYGYGMPGMGKTHTVISVLNRIAQIRRETLGPSSTHSTPTSSTQKTLSSTEELGYRVISFNGQSITQKAPMLKELCKELKVSFTGSCAEMEALLTHTFSTTPTPILLNQQALGVDIDSPAGSSSSDSSRSSSPVSNSSSPANRRRTTTTSTARSTTTRRNTTAPQRRQKTVPMTILIIDEMDKACSSVVDMLLSLTAQPSSSLIILGLGNTLTKFGNTHCIQNLCFTPYTDVHTLSILKNVHPLIETVFQHTALSMLSKSISKNSQSKYILSYILYIFCHVLLILLLFLTTI